VSICWHSTVQSIAQTSPRHLTLAAQGCGSEGFVRRHPDRSPCTWYATCQVSQNLSEFERQAGGHTSGFNLWLTCNRQRLRWSQGTRLLSKSWVPEKGAPPSTRKGSVYCFKTRCFQQSPYSLVCVRAGCHNQNAQVPGRQCGSSGQTLDALGVLQVTEGRSGLPG
jgi:hypothetical protein